MRTSVIPNPGNFATKRIHGQLLFIVLFFSTILHQAKAQILPVPVIDSVSVTAENGIIMSWSVADDPRINRFVVYRKAPQDFGYLAIDTVGATIPHLYIDNNANPTINQWQYTVAALSASDSLSGLANHHSCAMVDLDDFHLCSSEIDLSWLPYVGASNPQYTIVCYAGNSLVDARDEGFEVQGSVSLMRGQEHRIAVRAAWDGGSSTSAFVNYWADTITLYNNAAISRIENKGQIFEVIVRNPVARDRDSTFLSLFSELHNQPYARFSQKNENADEFQFDVPVVSKIAYFKPSVKDICQVEYDENLAIGSIELKGTDLSSHIYLQWNSVGNVQNLTYSVLKKDTQEEVIETFASGGSTQYVLNNAANGASQICFRIVATNDTLEVISNTVCIRLSDDLLWPNAFVPNGDGFDDYFGPVVNRFVPEFFVLRIYNKHGMPLFVSNSIENKWSGHYNGSLVPKGAYIWQSEYTIAGKQFKKNGTVTVIY